MFGAGSHHPLVPFGHLDGGFPLSGTGGQVARWSIGGRLFDEPRAILEDRWWRNWWVSKPPLGPPGNHIRSAAIYRPNEKLEEMLARLSLQQDQPLDVSFGSGRLAQLTQVSAVQASTEVKKDANIPASDAPTRVLATICGELSSSRRIIE